MQVSKTYKGTLAGTETNVSRVYSYGSTVTPTYDTSKIDFINTTVAAFLRDTCGVADVAYAAKGTSSEKFLWIYGVPFLFAFTSSYLYLGIFAPVHTKTTSLAVIDTRASSFLNTSASRDYAFGLIFTGNPKAGFALRLSSLNTNGTIANINSNALCIMNTMNTINGKNSVPFFNSVNASTTLHTVYNVDIDPSTKILDLDTMNDTEPNGAIPEIIMGTRSNTLYPEKFPLVPYMLGPHITKGIYCVMGNMGLPLASTTSYLTMPEVIIGTRKFIVTSMTSNRTNALGMGSGYLNMGLIEVSD